MRERLIRLQSVPVIPGDPCRNTAVMLSAVDAARRDGITMLVFPEMSIPGYLLGDEWERPSFLRECIACGDELRAASQGLIVVFGNVAVDPARRNEDGRARKYNALFVARDGVFVMPENGLSHPFTAKTLLPNYREFEDSRHFYDNRKLALENACAVADLLVPLQLDGCKVGMLLCEDAWDTDYGLAPARILAEKGAELLILINSSPFTLGKSCKRDRVFSALASRYGCPILAVNSVGIQDNGKTVYVFDGGCVAYDSRGGVQSGPAPFEPGALTLAWPPAESALPPPRRRLDAVEDIDRALLYGIDAFGKRLGVRRLVVGVSGGIDSALVAAMYSRVLDAGNLLLAGMPSRFNSGRTRALARRLADALGCLFVELPIDASVELTRGQIDGLEVSSPDGRNRRRLVLDGKSLENVQARDRSSRILAALSSAFGGVFSCNANKAELTVGYSTLYGDLGGYLAPIGDLWKQDVYRLARHVNERVFKAEVIPEDCFNVPPSAELSAAQDIEKGLGDPLKYPYHDALFRSWVESWERPTPEEILDWYIRGELESKLGIQTGVGDFFESSREFILDLERWWDAYQGIGVAKRIQAPPVLAVTRRAFGFDHREAQLGARYTRRYRELRDKALSSG